MIQSSDMKPPRKPTIVNKTVDTSEEVEVVLSEKYSFLSAKIKRLISARRMRKIQAKAKNSAIVPTYDSDHTGDNSDTDSDTDTDTVIADNNSSPFSKVAIVPTRLVPTKDSDHTGDNSDTDADTYTDTDTDTDTDTYTDTDADTDADTDTDVDVKTSHWWDVRENNIRSDERKHKLFDVEVGSHLLSYSCQCWSGPNEDDIFEYLLTF